MALFGTVSSDIHFRNRIINGDMTSSSAYSVPSGEGYTVQHRIEGFNVSDLGWGTANAQTVTLSFWVRSSLTGTFGGSVTNSAFNRSYPFAYTISSANTFEYKTVTIVGDTTGTWLTDNGVGHLVLSWRCVSGILRSLLARRLHQRRTWALFKGG
jgi:hypothetical protein